MKYNRFKRYQITRIKPAITKYKSKKYDTTIIYLVHLGTIRKRNRKKVSLFCSKSPASGIDKKIIV